MIEDTLPPAPGAVPLHEYTSAQGLGCTISNVRAVYALGGGTWMCKADLTFDGGETETVDYCARESDAMATGQWVVARIAAGLAGPVGTRQEWDALQAAKPVAVPQVVSMRQARIALSRAGLLSRVQPALDVMEGQAGEEARLEWEYATELERTHPLVASLGAALGLDDAALDDLFRTAVTL